CCHTLTGQPKQVSRASSSVMKKACRPLARTPHPRCARPLPERGEAERHLLSSSGRDLTADPAPARGEAERHLLSSSGRDLTADPAPARGEAEKRLPLPARGEGG